MIFIGLDPLACWKWYRRHPTYRSWWLFTDLQRRWLAQADQRKEVSP